MENQNIIYPVTESGLRHLDGTVESLGFDDHPRMWARLRGYRAAKRGKATWVLREVDTAGNATPWVERDWSEVPR